MGHIETKKCCQHESLNLFENVLFYPDSKFQKYSANPYGTLIIQ